MPVSGIGMEPGRCSGTGVLVSVRTGYLSFVDKIHLETPVNSRRHEAISGGPQQTCVLDLQGC